jgi:NADPH-dependent 2,4-dienoyl-CoA reductase/sulfur reductase-like enzyme
VPDGLEVVLDDGTRCAADLVVVGIGIIPNVELAESAGIEVDGGLLVSADYRTSAPDVFAAGDVIRLRGEDGALLRREEHWEAAQLSGQHAAYGMLGLEPPSRGAPWFWTDRHGIHLEAVGRLSGPGDVVVREGGDHPAVFLLDEGLLAGAAAIDDAMTVRAARRLIDQRIPVSRGELSDPSVPLRSLLKARR